MTAFVLDDLSHAIGDIPAGGLRRQLSLSPEALHVLKETLGMESLTSAAVAYRIEALAGGGFRLAGQVAAEGWQLCVVSLDPVPAAINETFDVEFWPDLPKSEGGEEKSVLDAREVEPLEGDVIPVGRIVFETLSAGLDPYPRKAGAAFEWAENRSEAGGNVSPFSVLAKLKNKP